MSKNMSSTNHSYESAANKYSELQDKYTGDKGYERSLEQANKGSSAIAQNTINQQKSAIRSSGASKGAAAVMAGNGASNAAANAYGQQQQMAYNSGTDSLNAQGTKMQASQAEGQNKYNRSWGNLGAATGIAGSIMGGISSVASDENLKKSVKLTDTDEFFKKYKKRNFADLKLKESK